MESQDYEHYRNLTLMFFFEKLLEKGGKFLHFILFFDDTLIVFVVQIQMKVFYSQDRSLPSVRFLAKRESGPTFLLIWKICGRLPPALHKRTVFQHLLN